MTAWQAPARSRLPPKPGSALPSPPLMASMETPMIQNLCALAAVLALLAGAVMLAIAAAPAPLPV